MLYIALLLVGLGLQWQRDFWRKTRLIHFTCACCVETRCRLRRHATLCWLVFHKQTLTSLQWIPVGLILLYLLVKRLPQGDRSHDHYSIANLVLLLLLVNQVVNTIGCIAVCVDNLFSNTSHKYCLWWCVVLSFLAVTQVHTCWSNIPQCWSYAGRWNEVIPAMAFNTKVMNGYKHYTG